MLTVTRRVGERLRIGDDIYVVVKDVRGKHVRLGIHAPEKMKIYREEIDPDGRNWPSAEESAA